MLNPVNYLTIKPGLALIFLATLLTPVTTAAKSQQTSNQAQTTQSIPAGDMLKQTPKLSAQAYLLYDLNSKQVLAEHNSNERIEPASLTKLMTAYLVFSSLKQSRHTLNEKVTPSSYAIRAHRSESRLFLEHKKSISISELLYGLIVASANDAARALAETFADNETAFAEKMNIEAKRLGMQNTNFVNATGLPDQLHYSSAHDLALLAAAVINDFPEYLYIYSKREFEYNHVKHHNRNRLLWQDPHVDGLKTGHTENAGYGLIATAKRNNHRLLSVVLGADSDHIRTSESQQLLNHGYLDFEMHQIYKKNAVVSNIRLWKGTENTVKAGLRDGLVVTLPKGQRPLLKATVETRQPMLAPIGDGQQVGVLKLSLDDKPYLETPLVSLQAVPLVNIFSRGIDSIRMIFSR